jgi:uncharacterized membrane protein YhaH (DUF805 family)
MGNVLQDLMGFDGRINRQRWWIGVVVLIIAGLILSWILSLIFGTGFIMDMTVVQDPAAMLAYVQRAAWVGLITSLVLTYPYIALTVKRRHDRGNNGYDAIGLIVLSLLSNLLTALGISPPMSPLGGVISVVLLVAAIYILVQVGFLRGTPGPNQYGPDPLQG